MKTLYPFQKQPIDELRIGYLAGHTRQILAAATGSGKTVMAAHMIHSAAQKGLKSLFIVDRIELVSQAVNHLRSIGLSVGVLQGENTYVRDHHEVIVASIQTIRSRNAPPSGFIIIDECHLLHQAHIDLLNHWDAVPVIGLSATPLREGLGKYFTNLVRGPSIQWLMDNKYLTPVRAFCPSEKALNEALSDVKVRAGDMDRLYRGFAHDQNRLHVAAKTGLLATASMALYAINRDNELYDRLEDWDRDSAWHIFVPKTGSHDGTPIEERYHHWRYPKLWEIGAISSIAERSVEGMLEGDGKEFGIDFLRILMEQFKLDYVPQAIRPMYEQYLNKNRFTGAPIETRGMESLSPFARSKPYTASVLKEAGLASRNLPRELQVSPVRTEALLRGYLNTWALYGLSLADAAVYDDKPDLRVDQYPVFRRFYSAEPAKRTKYETQFYTMLREATELRRTMRHMIKVSRPDITEEILKKPQVGEYDALNKANKGVQALNQEMKKIYIDDSLNSEQKRQHLDALTKQKNEFLESVVTEIEGQREPDQIRGGSRK